MAKSFLSILMITLLFGANIVLGQETNSAGSSFFITINQEDIDSSVAANAAGVTKKIALQELSSDELDQIVAGAVGDFLGANNDHINSVPWIILWDEISKQRNASTGSSIELTNNSSFMNGIQMNNIDK